MCGIAVTHSLHDALKFAKSLEHRGKEATGIAAIGYSRIDVVKWIGKASRFDYRGLEKIFPRNITRYHTFLVHTRYRTRGENENILSDSHPHTIGGKIYDRGSHIIIEDCEMAIVHNGQGADEYFKGIKTDQLKTNCDSEKFLHFFKKYGEYELIKKIPGSYTLSIADKNRNEVIVMRDRFGIKPGVLGKKDEKYCIASEDIVLRKNGGEFVENLTPGTIYYLYPDGSYREALAVKPKIKHCFFEWNYLADIDSIIDGVSIRRVRELLGEAFAKELPKEIKKEIDLISYLPNCPKVAARTMAKKLNIPFNTILYKISDDRAFMGKDRSSSINQNLFLRISTESFEDRVILILDDSIVRGNNSKKTAKLIHKEGKAQKCYLASYTPPIGIIGKDNEPRGCVHGVDTPIDDDFVARGKSLKEIEKIIGMPVIYLSLNAMFKVFEKLGLGKNKLCHFCIGGPKPF